MNFPPPSYFRCGRTPKPVFLLFFSPIWGLAKNAPGSFPPFFFSRCFPPRRSRRRGIFSFLFFFFERGPAAPSFPSKRSASSRRKLFFPSLLSDLGRWAGGRASSFVFLFSFVGVGDGARPLPSLFPFLNYVRGRISGRPFSPPPHFFLCVEVDNECRLQLVELTSFSPPSDDR